MTVWRRTTARTTPDKVKPGISDRVKGGHCPGAAVPAVKPAGGGCLPAAFAKVVVAMVVVVVPVAVLTVVPGIVVPVAQSAVVVACITVAPRGRAAGTTAAAGAASRAAHTRSGSRHCPRAWPGSPRHPRSASPDHWCV